MFYFYELNITSGAGAAAANAEMMVYCMLKWLILS